MSNFSRRDLLKVSGYTVGALAMSRLLSACAQATEVAGPVTLRLGSYTFGNVDKAYKNLVETYTKTHPDLKVEFEFADYSTFMDKLTTEIAAGTQPDVAMLIPDSFPKFYAQGLLLDLEDFMKSSNVTKSEWYPGGWVGLQFGKDQHHYSVPLTFDSDVLWYNKDLFDKDSIPYPDETWTYEKMVETAKALTKSSGDNTTQWGLGVGWEPWYQAMAMFGVHPWDQQDFTKSNFDSPEAIEAVQKFADLYFKHKVSPVQPPNSGLAVNGADVQFMAGSMAMLLGGSWNTQTYLDPSSGIKDFKFDNALSPHSTKLGTPMGVGQANAFVIFKSTKHPKESWELVNNVCLSDDGQKTLATAVEIPAKKTAAEQTYKAEWLSKLGHPDVQLTMMEKYTDTVQFGLIDENTWMVEVDNQLDAVWKGADVAATCKSIADKLNSLLKDAKAKYGS